MADNVGACSNSATLSDNKPNSDGESDADKDKIIEGYSSKLLNKGNSMRDPPSEEDINAEVIRFLEKYDFNQIKTFLVKLSQENRRLKLQLTEMSHHVHLLKLSNQEMNHVCSEIHVLKNDLHSVRERYKKSERKVTYLEQELRNNTINLTTKLDTVQKERDQLLIDLNKMSEEHRRLLNDFKFSQKKTNLVWKAVMPTIIPTEPPDAELMKHLKLCLEIVNNLEDSAFVESHRDESLLSWFEIADTIDQMSLSVEELKAEIICLKKHIHKEKLTERIRRDLIMKIKEHFTDILKYGSLLVHLKPHPTPPQIPANSEEERLREEISKLKSDLRSKEELVHSKDKEISELRDNIMEYQKHNDEVAILKDQLKVFEEDFHLEREAKESLAAEKESLKHELKEVHLRNQLFYQTHQIQNTQNYGEWSNIEPSVNPQPEPYVCFLPNCNKAFTSSKELEEHVNDCLGKG